MTKRRSKDSQEAPEVLEEGQEATEEITPTQELTVKLTEDESSKAPQEAPVGSDTSTQPAHIELQTPQVTEIKEKQSKEEIEAAIQQKLSNRDISGDPGSEVNRQQLKNEVKQVAETLGFPLSRGTEAGAALLARAKNRSAR